MRVQQPPGGDATPRITCHDGAARGDGLGAPGLARRLAKRKGRNDTMPKVAYWPVEGLRRERHAATTKAAQGWNQQSRKERHHLEGGGVAPLVRRRGAALPRDALLLGELVQLRDALLLRRAEVAPVLDQLL